jgi:hypothetical protein
MEEVTLTDNEEKNVRILKNNSKLADLSNNTIYYLQLQLNFKDQIQYQIKTSATEEIVISLLKTFREITASQHPLTVHKKFRKIHKKMYVAATGQNS